MDTITTILIVLYFLCYLIFFVVKSLRDYIMEYQRGFPYRWNNSIWKNRLPEWAQSYILSEDELFKETAPAWAIKLLWDKKNDRFKVAVDGWHQLDGIIFLLPHTVLFIAICRLAHIAWYWTVLGLVALPFLFWYQYFNLNYHIWQQKYNRQWFRIHWWVRILFGKK